MELMPDSRFPDISPLLSPKSVVVIGASGRAGNLGGDTVRRLVKFGFPGPVWAVNRSGEPVEGCPAFPDVDSIPAVPDMAIFAIPADSLLQAIKDCIAKGIRAGVAYAGGLAEAGGAGIDLQRAITELCLDSGFMLCGPNCVGLIDTHLPVTATFATALFEMDRLRPGNISMLSQSGGIGTTALSLAESSGFGFRYLVSSGNEAVITFPDYLYAFARDEKTDVILGYLEGVSDGPKLVAALDEARRRGKPVIVIKAGATEASARAAQAHTGALVGENRVFDAILSEAGAIRVHSVEEAIDVALMLAGSVQTRMPQGRNVGVVTFGGGNGVLAADQCAENGMSTPSLGAGAVERLRPLLASVASAANPMDLTPTTAFRAESLALLPAALDVIAAEPNIDSILFIVGSLAAKAGEISEVIRNFAERSPKPVCVSWPSPPIGVAGKLAASGIYTFFEPARGIRALNLLATSTEAAKRHSPTPVGLTNFDWERHIGSAQHAIVTEDRCHAILREAGLQTADSVLAVTEAEAAMAAEKLGYPVVLKGISPAVLHRAAADLLAVSLTSRAEVEAAYRRLSRQAAALSVVLDGILVQKMELGGTELLVSVFRDPVFGMMVSCGSGGGLTEFIDDVVTRSAPVDLDTAAAMIDSLRVRKLARDKEGPLPVRPAAEFVAALSQAAAGAPYDQFMLEVNPIKWTREKAVAVDGLIIVGSSLEQAAKTVSVARA